MHKTGETLDDTRDDAALLASIALHRDHAAFAEILRRYEHDTYALALHITATRQKPKMPFKRP